MSGVILPREKLKIDWGHLREQEDRKHRAWLDAQNETVVCELCGRPGERWRFNCMTRDESVRLCRTCLESGRGHFRTHLAIAEMDMETGFALDAMKAVTALLWKESHGSHA